jgi:hypothetical protein
MTSNFSRTSGTEDRDRRLVLAASRGAYVAVVQPTKHLADAARAFGYEARTFEGDAFETAFAWARENVDADRRLRAELPRCSKANANERRP